MQWKNNLGDLPFGNDNISYFCNGLAKVNNKNTSEIIILLIFFYFFYLPRQSKLLIEGPTYVINDYPLGIFCVYLMSHY